MSDRLGDITEKPRIRRLRRALLVMLLLLDLLLLQVLSGQLPKPVRQRYQPRYHTFAHRLLDFEAKKYHVSDESYQALDELLASVQQRVAQDERLSELQDPPLRALRMLQLMDEVFVESGFVYAPDDWTYTLSDAFRFRSIDEIRRQDLLADESNVRRKAYIESHPEGPFRYVTCMPGTFLTMAAGEVLGLSIRPVRVPRHMFARVHLDENQFLNWDGNHGRGISDYEYRRQWEAQDWQVFANVYLVSLTERQLEALKYATRGLALGERGWWREAIEDYKHALALDPFDVYSMSNLARQYVINGNADQLLEALELATKAASLAPDQPVFLETLAMAQAETGHFTAAIETICRAISLSPDPKLQEHLDRFQQGLLIKPDRIASGSLAWFK